MVDPTAKHIERSLQHGAMMTTAEAAAHLNVSPSTIRRWDRKGILVAYRIGSRGDRRFLRDDLELLKAQVRLKRAAPDQS